MAHRSVSGIPGDKTAQNVTHRGSIELGRSVFGSTVTKGGSKVDLVYSPSCKVRRAGCGMVVVVGFLGGDARQTIASVAYSTLNQHVSFSSPFGSAFRQCLEPGRNR